MNIFLFLIFFKSICLFLQNLVLRIHIRVFGPNAANRYYSTAYHYLNLNGKRAQDNHNHQIAVQQGTANVRRRRHHQYQKQGNNHPDDNQYYFTKLNHTRSLIRQQQQIHLQSLHNSSREHILPPEEHHRGLNLNCGGGISIDTGAAKGTQPRDDDIAFVCVRVQDNNNSNFCGAIRHDDDQIEQTVTVNSERTGEPKNLIRKRIKKSYLDSPGFE